MLGFPVELIKCNILCIADRNQQPLGQRLPQECPSWCISTPAVFFESDPCHLTWCAIRELLPTISAQGERSGCSPPSLPLCIPKASAAGSLSHFQREKRNHRAGRQQPRHSQQQSGSSSLRQSDIQGEETSAGPRALANF